MPLHQQRLNQRKDPQRYRNLNQDAKNRRRQKRLSSLRAQIQQI